MFAAIGSKDFADMYSHIDASVKFAGAQDLPDELEYQALADRMEALSKKNSVKTAFLGDGLQVYRTNEMVGHVECLESGVFRADLDMNEFIA